jgi:HD-GYP domain-containing protein (c-di-GMP phosphodiesterase class II)
MTITAADACDAMTSDRRARNGLAGDAVVAEVVRQKGNQVDPTEARALVDIIWLGAGRPKSRRARAGTADRAGTLS